mgnify:CR=1 FL=1
MKMSEDDDDDTEDDPIASATRAKWKAFDMKKDVKDAFHNAPTVTAPNPKAAAKVVERCRFCNITRAQNDGKLLTCTACKSAHYCDRECQQRDWKHHKVDCQKLQATASTTTSSKEDVSMQDID